MRKRSRFYLLSIAAGCLFVFLAACSGKEGRDLPRPLNYEMRNFGKVYHDGGEGIEDDVYCMFRYPVFSDGDHAETINRYLLNWVANLRFLSPAEPGEIYTGSITIEELADNFFEEYEASQKELSGYWPYQFELRGFVLLNRSGLLTVELFYFVYLGGAHDYGHTEYFIFDTQTGKRLGLNDVFAEGFEDRLNKLIDTWYRMMKGLSSTERLDGEKSMLTENYIHFNDNFAITDKGVTFFYNMYEIASYARGPTKIDLPYSELMDILRPEFKKTMGLEDVMQ